MLSVVSIILALAAVLNAQTTSDCGAAFGCFISPRNCVGIDCNFIVKWENSGAQTKFEYFGRVQQGLNIAQSWIGVAFSNDRIMGDENVVMCKNPAAVQHYYNVGKDTELLDPSNPTVGLTATSVTTQNGFILCKFTRDKTNPVADYANLNNQYHLLVANGPLIAGLVDFHDTGRDSSPTKIDFASRNIYYSDF